MKTDTVGEGFNVIFDAYDGAVTSKAEFHMNYKHIWGLCLSWISLYYNKVEMLLVL